MTIHEQNSAQYNKKWQQRIVKTNFVTATVVLIFEIAYYFLLTAVRLREQSSVEYIIRFIILPTAVIFSVCSVAWFIVYRSHKSTDIKSMASILVTVAICATVSSVHNIFATTLCSFFVPLSISVVFGKMRITNIVGSCCVVGELIAVYFASMDLRGKDPYFLLDCLMLFIVFGISWYATLLLMKNEQEKRLIIDHMWQEQSLLQQKICRDELTGLYNMLGLQLYTDGKINENCHSYRNSSLAFLDIDDFKKVNDTFGHEVGNTVIIYISDCIRRNFPENSCVARYGGDEFVVLLPSISTVECMALLDNLQKTMTSPIAELDGGTLSLSCGVSSYDFNTSVLDAINKSDQAMYKAKSSGKNRYVEM